MKWMNPKLKQKKTIVSSECCVAWPWQWSACSPSRKNSTLSSDPWWRQSRRRRTLRCGNRPPPVWPLSCRAASFAAPTPVPRSSRICAAFCAVTPPSRPMSCHLCSKSLQVSSSGTPSLQPKSCYLHGTNLQVRLSGICSALCVVTPLSHPLSCHLCGKNLQVILSSGSRNEEHEPQLGHHPEAGQWQTGVEELRCCLICQQVWRVVIMMMNTVKNLCRFWYCDSSVPQILSSTQYKNTSKTFCAGTSLLTPSPPSFLSCTQQKF